MSNLVRKLAIGTAQFGMPYGIANRNGQVHADAISEILDSAWQNGIDTIDTAKAYGASEESVGNYLKYRPGNNWYIITKISDVNKKLTGQVQDSSEKLTILPYAVLAHSAELFIDADFQKELAEASNLKMIGKAGVSVYNEGEISRILKSNFRTDVIQLPLNILDNRLYRRGTLERLHDKGIEIHVRSAFLQGLFYLPEADLKARFEDVVPHLSRLSTIATGAGLTLAEMSLLWLVSLEEVSKVVIGVDNADQLKMHLATIKKNVDPAVFQDALSVHYENESILNPSLWPSTS